MRLLARACIDKSIDEILALSDVQERIEKYHEQTGLFKAMIRDHARPEGNAVVVDLRGVETIHAGNRFLLYTLYPDQNISVWIVDGRNKQNVAITIGYSIINRTATVNVGSLLLKYGGGGHIQAGTCQISYDDADRILAELIRQIS
jgi:nanoRNase/pAp phosphatase (c-di-AMP/oligoRNAs hydrolase)